MKSSAMECQAVVMAAGKGSRMSDLTADQRKSMLTLGNLPMIWYPLYYLQKSGFQEAIVIVNESASDLYKALEDKLTIQLDIILIPSSEDWGTADSLRHISIRDKIKADVVVISCDLVTDFPLYKLLDIYRTYSASLTTLLAPVPDYMNKMPVPGSKSKQKYEKDYIGLEQSTGRLMFLSSEADYDESIPLKWSVLKKHPRIQFRSDLLDAHLYIIKKWVLDYLVAEQNVSTIKGELVPLLVKKQFTHPKPQQSSVDGTSKSDNDQQDIYSFAGESDDLWKVRDMSTWNDHTGDLNHMYHGDSIRCYGYIMNEGQFCMRANTTAAFAELNRQIISRWSSITDGVERPLIHSTVELKSKTQIESSNLIGEGTVLGEKISVKNSVVGKHCKIGEKVKIISSVILNHVTVEDGAVIQNSVVSNNATVGTNSELKDCVVGFKQQVDPSSKHSNVAIIDENKLMEI